MAIKRIFTDEFVSNLSSFYAVEEQPSEWLRQCTDWARKQRCPVVALDPPGHGSKMTVPSRALVVPVLPLIYSPQQGVPHLVKLGLPSSIYKELGITYRSFLLAISCVLLVIYKVNFTSEVGWISDFTFFFYKMILFFQVSLWFQVHGGTPSL